jgi:hypothetical protein
MNLKFFVLGHFLTLKMICWKPWNGFFGSNSVFLRLYHIYYKICVRKNIDLNLSGDVWFWQAAYRMNFAYRENLKYFGILANIIDWHWLFILWYMIMRYPTSQSPCRIKHHLNRATNEIFFWTTSFSELLLLTMFYFHGETL